MQPRATDAPKHWFQYMKALKGFPDDIQAITLPIFENGAYWMHSENILLSALSDHDQSIRERAIAQIMKIRHDVDFRKLIDNHQREFKKMKKCSYKTQRAFIKPTPNYDASTFFDMNNELYFEPPYTKSMSDEEVKAFSDQPLELGVKSHSVLTERTIRDVDSVATKSTSEEVREGIVHSRLLDRKWKPELETKSNMVA